MTETLPDVRTSNLNYINLNEATGLPVGTSLLIQNKRYGSVYVQIVADQPEDSNRHGFMLVGEACCVVESPVHPVWVLGENNNYLSVQIMTEEE